MQITNPLTAAIIAVFCLFTHSAAARIGETLDECIRRYGKPVTPPKPGEMVNFYKSGIAIAIWFFDGKAERIIFMKHREGSTQFEPLSDGETALLMTVNGFGRKWEKGEFDSANQTWHTEDLILFAQRDLTQGSLQIATRDNLLHVKAAEDLKKLSGF